MYNLLNDFEELKQLVIDDKNDSGPGASTRNRYPIRFVLLDDFVQCGKLVAFLQSEVRTVVRSVADWVDHKYPDLMVTYTNLASRIQETVHLGQDQVIAPFSELARFYDNVEHKTFEVLIKTIKAIEATPEAVARHQRVYIPIVGLEGKMECFAKDSQCSIWRLKTESPHDFYRLILTNGTTYDVRGLDERYNVVHNISQWLSVWQYPDHLIKPDMICCSPSIFANAVFAQPDNAFAFVKCDNAYDFLVKGLKLDFMGIDFVPDELDDWNCLAAQIELDPHFNFGKYVEAYFNVNGLDNYKVFIKQWLDNQGKHERWLLARYYLAKTKEGDYLRKLLLMAKSFSGNDFIEQLALDMPAGEDDIKVRDWCLKEAVKKHVTLRDEAQGEVLDRLVKTADKYNATSALKYFTGVTDREKELAIFWLGKGKIQKEQIKPFFPDLFCYLSDEAKIDCNVPQWFNDYFAAYKEAKVRNVYTDGVKSLIADINASDVAFDKWYQTLSTTRTLLLVRKDIDVFYWIDGLGTDWITLVDEIVKEHNQNGIFLTEVMIARALLPTVTGVNKPDLQKLTPDGTELEKSGDLDALAHQSTNVWPKVIVEEIQKVRDIVERILDKYNGKKIAIISDHGLTYLSQLCGGLNLTGVKSDHHGRVAVKNDGRWTADHNYVILDDGKTACALNHASLCGKVPKGQGTHGGCTPEEVLVPIFVISGQNSVITWTAHLLSHELSGANPRLKVSFKNLPDDGAPFVVYNNRSYQLHRVAGGDVFESAPLQLDSAVSKVTVSVGRDSVEFDLNIRSGATENDLFAGF